MATAKSKDNKKPRVRVVSAVVMENGKILCTQRTRSHQSYNSERWEFPGGKVKKGESDHEALIREIREEMKWDIFVGRPIGHVVHEYPDFIIDMTAYLCRAGEGEFLLLEHLDARWLTPEELPSLNWSEADKILVDQFIAEETFSNE
ncbi:MAG: (deoxy)nucleoside triphosphate pyrophosphohydrolase [Prevotella sp.]|nr:(deoxy)nucleoside triphosphate pyrophosphohydrolase [Prevotella sp.]